MSNTAALHPDDTQLLRFCDGELPAPEDAWIEQHLTDCWECRTQLEDIQQTLGDFVHYRNVALYPELPAPPQPWNDLRLQLKIESGRRRAILPRFLYAAAAAAVVCIALYRFDQTPSVRAAELLQKAVAAEHRSTAKAHRIQIRTGARAFTPVENGSNRDLEAAFAEAHFSWTNPLSAESYLAWLQQLPEKHADVETVQDMFEIRTTTSSGILAEALIQMRKDDLHAVREVLQFRNRESIEISEIQESAMSSAGPAALPRELKGASTKGEKESVTAGDELHAIAALHAIGADLGEPIEVTRTADRIVVTATGIDRARQEQVRAALAPLTNVEIHFPAPERTVSRAIGSGRRVSPGDTRFEIQLRDRLGGAEAFSKFADSLLQHSDAMMARAYALRSLAERFSPEAESQFSDADRRILARLRLEHSGAFSTELAEIDRAMRPVVDIDATPDIATAGEPWQSATQDLWGAAQNVDRLLGSLLGGSNANASATPTALAGALMQLEAQANRYQQFGTRN